jgi:hypothetical protein
LKSHTDYLTFDTDGRRQFVGPKRVGIKVIGD